jgi:hypothetical protein
MARIDRIREVINGPVGPEYFDRKVESGWRLTAVEWEREAEGEPEPAGALIEDVPFGLRVANDCLHLEEEPNERQVLTLMLDLIVQDFPLSRVAQELNLRGFRTRQGRPWAPVSVFNMLPRLIEVGPRIFSTEEWAERKRHLLRVS